MTQMASWRIALAILISLSILTPTPGCNAHKNRSRRKKKKKYNDAEKVKKARAYEKKGDKYRRMFIENKSMTGHRDEAIENYKKALKLYQGIGERYDAKGQTSPYDNQAQQIQQNVHELQKMKGF